MEEHYITPRIYCTNPPQYKCDCGYMGTHPELNKHLDEEFQKESLKALQEANGVVHE